MDPVEALTQLGGVARAQDLLQVTSRKKLRHAVAAGRISHPFRDRYALPSAPPALAAAGRFGGHVSHLSAASVHGWEIARQPFLPQLLLRHEPQEPLMGVRCFQYQARGEDIEGLVTGPTLTALLCARDLPFDEALAVVDSGLRHRDVEAAELQRRAVEWPARVRRVIAHADERAANPFESMLRARAIASGAQVVPQWQVVAHGLTLHPDLADPIAGLAIEGDSWGFHASRVDHDRDCRRYNALVATGWLVLRFTYEQVMSSPEYVEESIRRALAIARAAA